MGGHHWVQAQFCALQQPQQQLRCCWLHCQAHPTLPVHILREDACLALSPAVLLCPRARVALDYREICPDTAPGFLNCLKDHILDSIYWVSPTIKTYNSSLEWTGTKYILGGWDRLLTRRGRAQKYQRVLNGISKAKGLWFPPPRYAEKKLPSKGPWGENFRQKEKWLVCIFASFPLNNSWWQHQRWEGARN